MSKIQSFFTAAFALSICISAPHSAAQGEAGTEISFRVLCFEYRDNVTSVFAPGSEGGKIPVPLYTSDFSEVFKAKFSGGKAALYIEMLQPDGKIQNKIVAEGPLAPGLRQAFLLVPSDSQTGPIYRIVAYADGEETFPMGATRVINFSPFPIRLNLAGSELSPIKPGTAEVYPVVKKVDDWNMYTAKIQFGVAADQWVDVATQSWKASDSKRDWVIVRFDAATKQPAIRQYQDIPPWRKTVLPATGASNP